ncbi:MAG: glycosyltransferase family 2 protein [Pseudomonadota bacterium]
MLFLLGVLCFILSLYIFLQIAFLVTQIMASFLPKKSQIGEPLKFPNTIVLIPAHNEEKVISETLCQLKSVAPQDLRIIVIADNCSDNTAQCVQENGYEVIIRNDVECRGKGYALSYGIDYLRSSPPEVVVFIDADCKVHNGAIERIASQANEQQQPIQALYLMERAETASLTQKIASFAFTLKNYVRLLGLKNIGVPTHLVGTGMAFPWDIIKNADLASGNIVEDMKLGMDLVRQGYHPCFCPDACVTSKFPETEQALQTQKTRWSHGHLKMILTEAIPLFKESVKQRSWRIFLFAYDLTVLPVTLLMVALFSMTLITGVFYIAGLSTYALFLNILSVILLSISLVLTWAAYAKHLIAVSDLKSLPNYVLFKLNIYRKFLTKREEKWVRTERK